MVKETMEHWSRQAEHYVTSRVHSSPTLLAALVERVEPGPDDVVLDVATGTAHTAMAFAPLARMVYASDIALGMMEQGRAQAAKRELQNLCFQLGKAESLPFRDAAFDIVTCRVAAHHFQSYEKAIEEMARVAKPGGKVALVDSCSPEDPEVAALMNELENRRDPTHVRNLEPTTIHGLFAKQGLKVIDMRVVKVEGQHFNDWVKRAGTPANEIEITRQLFLNASPKAVEALRIRPEGDDIHFSWDNIEIVAVKPRV